MKSAEKQMTEEEKTADKEKSGGASAVMSIGVFLGVALAIILFLWLPKTAVNQLILHTPISDDSRFLRSLLEEILKIILFLGYMACTGLMADMRHNYEYHGAEHKTIAYYEAGEELTVENI